MCGGAGSSGTAAAQTVLVYSIGLLAASRGQREGSATATVHPAFFFFFPFCLFVYLFSTKKSGSFSNRGRKATSGRRQSPAGCTQPSVLLPVAPSCPGAGSPPSPGARLPPPPAPFYPSSIVVKGFARAVTVPQGPPRPSLLAVSRVLCRGAPRSRPRGSSRGMPPSGRLGFRDEGPQAGRGGGGVMGARRSWSRWRSEMRNECVRGAHGGAGGRCLNRARSARGAADEAGARRTEHGETN